MYPTVVLKKGKEVSVQRFHPWVFSGAIQHLPVELTDGDIVRVVDARARPLGVGHYQEGGSITIRLLRFEELPINQDFWEQRLRQAFRLRQTVGLPAATTDCYRLVHGEGDGLPSLIIDVYGNTVVLQCHSVGMHRQRAEIVSALRTVLGDDISIYDKSRETLPTPYAESVQNDYCYGNSQPQWVREHAHQFWVDWETGQKTGFFLDQRDNRQWLARYANGKSVLNAFCYTGGFSVYALQAGATAVHSVDVSARAMEVVEKNIALTPAADRHVSYTADVMQFIKQPPQRYDIAVIDPPAFAKTVSKRHNAVQAYKRLNALALKAIAPNGLLFTFSCSQVVDAQLFYDTIVAAAIEAGRVVKVMHHLSQPADHPVSIFHKEGSYLKGLVVFVE